jgi:hypothetical protein
VDECSLHVALNLVFNILRRKFFMKTLLALVFLVGSISNAEIPSTDSAKQVAFKLENSIPQCNSPNTADSTTGLSACSYTPPAGVCQLGSKGKGSITVVRKLNKDTGKDDLLLKISVSGLENCPDGTNLVPKFGFRKAHSSCSGSDCVNVDIIDFPLIDSAFYCSVEGGKCKLQAFLSASTSNLFNTDTNTIYTNISCGLAEWPSNIKRVSCGLSL